MNDRTCPWGTIQPKVKVPPSSTDSEPTFVQCEVPSALPEKDCRSWLNPAPWAPAALLGESPKSGCKVAGLQQFRSLHRSLGSITDSLRLPRGCPLG